MHCSQRVWVLCDGTGVFDVPRPLRNLHLSHTKRVVLYASGILEDVCVCANCVRCFKTCTLRPGNNSRIRALCIRTFGTLHPKVMSALWWERCVCVCVCVCPRLTRRVVLRLTCVCVCVCVCVCLSVGLSVCLSVCLSVM